jgi:hypothetical protein
LSVALLKMTSPSRVTSKDPLLPVRSETSTITGAQAVRISAARPTALSR